MRKIVSVALIMFLIAALPIWGAAASSFSGCAVKLDATDGTVTVSGTHSLLEAAYITVLTERNGAVFYWNEGEASVSGDFKFSYKMNLSTDITGIYSVTIGGNNIAAPVTLSYGFANSGDVENLISEIKGTGDPKTALGGRESVFGLDIESPYFKALSDTAPVYNALKGATDLTGLQKAFYSTLGIASFNLQKSSDTKMVDYFREHLSLKTGADSYYYSLPDKGKLVLEMTGKSYSLNDINTFSGDFDKSAALLLVNSYDVSTRDKVYSLTQKLNADGYISVSASGLDNEAVKRLIALKPYVSLADYADKVTKAVHPPQPPGGSTGGGGGSVSGAASAPFPTPMPPAPSASPATTVFNDLSSVEWARQAINNLYEKGAVSGIGDGAFEPDRNINRAEFVKILVCAFGFEIVEEELPFDDVIKGEWFYPYISTAKQNNIITGISESAFGVFEPITREQMAVMAFRTLSQKGLTLPGQIGEMSFIDYDSISAYAAESVEALLYAGVINGIGENRFDPGGSATRAMAAKIVYELLERGRPQ